eukprot:3932823-Rhodomonas_salina.1
MPGARAVRCLVLPYRAVSAYEMPGIDIAYGATRGGPSIPLQDRGRSILPCYRDTYSPELAEEFKTAFEAGQRANADVEANGNVEAQGVEGDDGEEKGGGE